MKKICNLAKREDILINPGKGYVAYCIDKGNIHKQYERESYIYAKYIEYASCLNIKVCSWLAIQPHSENEFNWSVIDETIEEAKRLNKRVMFGVGLVVSTGGVTGNEVRSLVPQWVYDAGAKYNDIEGPNYSLGGIERNRIPEWEDPIYREKEEKFIKAIADRYDGHPQVECFINFTHGNWGEWHHLDVNNRECCKENLYIDFRGRVLDLEYFRHTLELFPRFFKKTPIMMPINTFDKEDELEPWAKEGVDKYSYGFKREGLITIPDCTYAMKYCAGKGPAFGEWQTSYAHYMADGRWSDELLDREIVDGKLTHYNLGYYGEGAWLYLKEKEVQVQYWANHMGYYYTVSGAKFNEDYSGEIAITIRNDGVTATYLDSFMEISLVDSLGNEVKKSVLDCVKLKEVGEKEEKTFVFDSPFEKQEQNLTLAVRFYEKSQGKEIQFANEVDNNGRILLKENNRVRVDFDERPRSDESLKGGYKGIVFEGDYWRTILRRDLYKTAAYGDLFLRKWDLTITIEKGTLVEFEAFGYGNLTITDQNGNITRCSLDKTPQIFKTGFSGESGRVTISFDYCYEVWCAQFLSFTYEK